MLKYVTFDEYYVAIGSSVATYIKFVNILANHESLSTIVLNNRDWSEIAWHPEILHLKTNLAIGFIQKNPLECIG